MLSAIRVLVPLTILGLALAGCASTDYVDIESRNFNIQQTSVPPGEAVASTEQITSLVHRSGPSYVMLIVSQSLSEDKISKEGRAGTPINAGSGFLVNGSGYVMTAAHVGKNIGNLVSAKAANGRVYSGEVVALRPEGDMALIKLRGFSGKAVTPGDSQCLAKGDIVYSLGRPRDEGDTARLGEFEAASYGRTVHYSGDDSKFGYPDAMVLRLSTQKGESGGPLFDEKGDLVGMIVSTLYDDSGKPLNLAHAVPSRTLSGFLCSNMQCSKEWRALATSQARCAS